MLAQLLAYAPFPAVGFLVFTVAWLVATSIWVWALLDCLRSGRVTGRERTVWIIALLATYVFGAVPYLLAVRLLRPLPPKG